MILAWEAARRWIQRRERLKNAPSGFTFPTIAATCAATTALSVVYKEDGNFDSFYFYEKPARHSFIDTEIIAAAPECYLRAESVIRWENT